MKVPYVLPFAAVLAFVCGAAHADPSAGQQAGRLKVCRKVFAASDAKLEIPYGAKFVFGGKDGIPLVEVVQTNFVDPANGRSPSGHEVKTLDNNGVAVAQIDMGGLNCLYLDAFVPASPGQDKAFPASFVWPAWFNGEARMSDKFVYTYFPQTDSTFYLVSEVGKNLQYVVHEMSTGAYTNHDKFNNVKIDDPIINAYVPNALRNALAEAKQYDAQTVDSQFLGTHLSDADLKDSDAIAKAMAQFRKSAAPLPKSRIFIVVPHRAPVKVPFDNTVIYGGKVEGLGFYVDIAAGTDGGDGTGVGVLDVFLNCRIAAIDVDSAKVLTVYDYSGGKTFPAARAANGSPFSALSDAEMFVALSNIAAQGANDMVPQILAAH